MCHLPSQLVGQLHRVIPEGRQGGAGGVTGRCTIDRYLLPGDVFDWNSIMVHGILFRAALHCWICPPYFLQTTAQGLHIRSRVQYSSTPSTMHTTEYMQLLHLAVAKPWNCDINSPSRLACLVLSVGMEYGSPWVVHLPVSLPLCWLPTFFFFFFCYTMLTMELSAASRPWRWLHYSTGSYICMFLICIASSSLLVRVRLWQTIVPSKITRRKIGAKCGIRRRPFMVLIHVCKQSGWVDWWQDEITGAS